VAGISPSWIILNPRESSVRKIPADESDISDISYRVWTRGIFRSRYQVGISNLSGISKSHAIVPIKKMAKKAWRNPVFQRDWVCLGLTFILLSIVIGLPHSNLWNKSERTKNKNLADLLKLKYFIIKMF